ncbi:hypothetical protein AB0945_40615 [Streptomyces sp. NPDC005474]|uniref:lipase/acyltransferase domain-containing protein n=1 Tax=Streptomyces sp. NPDC005474 TaxID=3154878 RepID=UPI0034534B8A
MTDANGREVWGLSGKALVRGIRTFGRSVTGLALPTDIGDDHPGDGVRAAGLMPDLHGLPGVSPLVDGYSGLLGWLERNFTLRRRLPGEDVSTPANLIDFAYDWRLSCRYNARRLSERVSEELGRWRESDPSRAETKVVFICHSMGGLVTREYVERCGGAEVTRRVITLGTPYRGSLDALVTLVNGLRPGFGPFRLDLTRFARSLPSLHQLTPDYACLTTAGSPPSGPSGLQYARELTGLPGVDEALLKDAALFHATLREAKAGVAYGVEYLPVGGAMQPTPTTAEVVGDGDGMARLTELLTIGGTDEGGDGRVPRLSSAHVGAGAETGRAAYTPWEQHGSLQNNSAVRWAIWGWLTPRVPVHRGPEEGGVQLGVSVPEVLVEGEAGTVEVSVPQGTPGHDELAVAVCVDEGADRTMRNLGAGRYMAPLAGLAPGAHRVRVSARHAPEATVTALVLVLEREPEAGGE